MATEKEMTKEELLEAFNKNGIHTLEDLVDAMPISQSRRAQFWFALFLNFQWQRHQARRGLLPTFSEAGMEAGLRAMFTGYRSFEGWWDTRKASFQPEFVEFVEEQRAKAA